MKIETVLWVSLICAGAFWLLNASGNDGFLYGQ
jgi:hypothetical protein